MNERAIFMEALDKDTLAERSAYLHQACGGDTELLRRIEALLTSHEQAGSFLHKPVPQRMAAGLAHPDGPTETHTESPACDGASERLDFLTPSDKPGSLGRLGHFEVLEVIGRGGMGVVLRAFDEHLHRMAAIKVMAPTFPANGAARQRFVREARAAAAVRDEHVVGIYAVEEAAAVPYLVMEYIAGVSLQQRLDRGGSLEVKEILRIGAQAAAGLAAAHAQGLIHRDVKPANILLENSVERVKITDFGLARAAADASLTQQGVVAGTPQYMAPEQARGEALDHRADLFSLGSVLYALCTGRPPFRAENTLAVLKRVCEDMPCPIREINPDVPEWLVAIIARLQAKDPAERFQSAQEVADLLGRELATMQCGGPERPPTYRSAPPARRSRRRWVAGTAGLLLFVAGMVLTESIGITHLAATVLRGLTPDHTSVAKGEEGENDIKPAETRAPAPSGLVQPFVILANPGRGEMSYETLAKAVAGAWNGDVIEIRGDGPFISPGLPPITGRSLTIRAGAGARPVLRVLRWHWIPEMVLQGRCFFMTDSDLVLEGLVFQEGQWDLALLGAGVAGLLGSPLGQGPLAASALIHESPDLARLSTRDTLVTSASREGSLYVANCRIQNHYVENTPQRAAIDIQCPTCVVRNSELFWNGDVVNYTSSHEQRLLTLDNNCLSAGCGALWMCYDRPGQRSRVCLTHNTFQGRIVLFGSVSDQVSPAKPVFIEAAGNVFDGLPTIWLSGKPGGKIASDADAEALLRLAVKWTDRRNAYGLSTLFYATEGTEGYFPRMKMTLEGWNQCWGTAEADSLQGKVHFQGGNMGFMQARDHSEDFTAPDCLLLPDSTGYRAGEDGKDLGADIDLVGPGPAYERWKKTPAYQQWLQETGQKK